MSRYMIDEFQPAPFRRDYRVDDLLDVDIVDLQESTAANTTVMSGGVNFGNLSRIGAKIVCDSCQGYLEKKSPAIFIKWQVSSCHLCLLTHLDPIFCDEEHEAVLLQG